MAPTKPTSKPTLPSEPPTAMPMDQSGPLELDDVPNQNLGSLEFSFTCLHNKKSPDEPSDDLNSFLRETPHR
uniref:Uncharacterized protein n=1 Tax=Caenorhabditis japonica TaxID=281687 RepID=A0A8R1EPA0_CAEJA